ncbi:MAG: hypothetical protein JXR70_13430 [Spirochaetales bacterium]|nr:hypothetical protein [Spirochaetales bacterium]
MSGNITHYLAKVNLEIFVFLPGGYSMIERVSSNSLSHPYYVNIRYNEYYI